jgi:hypothetical protein
MQSAQTIYECSKTTLNEAQWRVIGDTSKVLKPFMSAQKLL